MLISRVADAETRAQLEMDDSWDQQIEFYEEKFAKGEYDWLRSHTNMREFLLVRLPLSAADELDDDLPWDEIALGPQQ